MLGKRLINSNSAAAGGSCTTDTLQILGDTSCIAYYKMSDATDESGNYDGTATSVNFNVAGKFGNAGSFNGSSSSMNLNSAVLPANNFSISMWINTNAIGDQQYIITQYELNGANVGRFVFYVGTTGLLSIAVGSNGSTFGTTLNAGAWYHVALVKNSTWECYLNGSSIGTWSDTVNITTTRNTQIGSRESDSAQDQWNGKIDNIRIFNKALSSNEVTTLYNEVQCVPTIVPTDNFNSVLYTGDGGTKAITGVGFQPDLTWIKQRSASASHSLQDTVRGAGQSKNIYSDDTAAEGTYGQYGYLSAFGTDGFTVVKGSGNHTNTSSSTYVAWNWKAGGAAVSNTDGTITSQVSANVDAGFSIVSWTGNSTTGATVGHKMDAVPEMIFVKRLQTPVDNWAVYNVTIGNSYRLALDATAAKSGPNRLEWNNTTPTSTVFTLGNHSAVNQSSSYIAYCFHSVEGYSKIGSYTGTGASGNSILTGFRPAFVMVKRTDSTGVWVVLDNKRNITNPRNSSLYLNTSAQEDTGSTSGFYPVNFYSNGFEPIQNTGDYNASSASYIFMAFAEEVFNPNGVTRNATNPFGDASELALYKFEDNANDAEGSYNGTASNVTYATGYIDKAAVFNGSSSYISASNPFSGQSGAGQEYSISLWFKADSFSKQYPTLFKGRGTGETPPYVWTDGSTIRFHGYRYGDATVSLNTGQWYHLAVIENNGVVSGYLDGTSITFANQSIWNQTNGANLFIGGDPNSSSYYFDGKIDQVRIFDRALDSGEVTQLYNE